MRNLFLTGLDASPRNGALIMFVPHSGFVTLMIDGILGKRLRLPDERAAGGLDKMQKTGIIRKE